MLAHWLLVVPLQVTAIRGVTIIDGPASTARPGHTVVMCDGRITSVGPQREVAIPRGARVIDGRGQYLLPGFVDVHAHVAFGPMSMTTKDGAPQMSFAYDHAASRETLQLLLAFGVTTVRNPAGPLAQALALRDSLERGQIPGPRVRTAGEAIDVIASPGLIRTVSTPETMRAEVARQAGLGVDYVKLYAGLSAPLVRAGVSEAHARGIKAITHTVFTSWTDAAEAGVDGIVHILPGSPLLIAPDQRAAYLATMRGTQFMAQWFRYADTASAEIRAMTVALVKSGVWLDPTLITFERMFRSNEREVRESADNRYAAPSMLASWRAFDLAQGWTDDDHRSAVELWPRVEAFVRHLHRSGVRLTIGTDANNPWTPPGISFHRELELFVKAGLPAAAVLRMATLSGAQSMGLDAEIGTVEAGKRADLVLLRGNPLADIANTQRITWVVQHGIPHRQQDLLPPRLRREPARRR